MKSLTILGGRDKLGAPEEFELTIRRGEIVSVVGPTGSGKSRLLADIEALAQRDTPSERLILVDGRSFSRDASLRERRRLVSQLSQNMNFVIDMSVRAFVEMHAGVLGVRKPALAAEHVIECANDLAGERFDPSVSLTQLSGGQSRALMIADVALLARAPIVLIDEIENAGVDRRQAIDLLVSAEKIVVLSTHDPLLALRAHRRIFVRNGGIIGEVNSGDRERECLAVLEMIDGIYRNARERIRAGMELDLELIPEPIRHIADCREV